MIDRNGNILNIASMNAYTPLTKIPAYSGAKAAIVNFTQWLATYFAKSGIRVNAIAPGFFVGNQNRGLLFNEDGTPTARTEKILAGTPMGRFGELEELVGAVLFLINNDAPDSSQEYVSRSTEDILLIQEYSCFGDDDGNSRRH